MASARCPSSVRCILCDSELGFRLLEPRLGKQIALIFKQTNVSSHNSKQTKSKTALRIVTQYRDKASMIYELKCGDADLAVRITPRQNSEDSGEWRIEARHDRSSETNFVGKWAATRREALDEVGRNWVSTEAETGRPSFDWEAVARVLTEVRAL